MTNRPTVEEIKAYRDLNECGLFEAKARLLKQWRLKRLQELSSQAAEDYSVEARCDALSKLIDFMIEVENDKQC